MKLEVLDMGDKSPRKRELKKKKATVKATAQQPVVKVESHALKTPQK
jgi:hypothetical protein